MKRTTLGAVAAVACALLAGGCARQTAGEHGQSLGAVASHDPDADLGALRAAPLDGDAVGGGVGGHARPAR